jgi:surfeit locus 1 family protein
MRLRFSIFGNSYHFTFKFFWLLCLFVAVFSYLGVWQLHRAAEKRVLMHTRAARASQDLVFDKILTDQADYRYRAMVLKGHFDNAHQILLDNKTHEGQVGYELYTPFRVEGSKQAILVDRGWVPASPDRHLLPALPARSSAVQLEGVLSLAPTHFALGAMSESQTPHYPLRLQFIDLKALSQILPYRLAPYVLWLDPKAPDGFIRDWKVTYMPPEKHVMYAVQWFAFALSLLVIFVALNLRKM